jgi:hypothetical protein
MDANTKGIISIVNDLFKEKSRVFKESKDRMAELSEEIERFEPMIIEALQKAKLDGVTVDGNDFKIVITKKTKKLPITMAHVKKRVQGLLDSDSSLVAKDGIVDEIVKSVYADIIVSEELVLARRSNASRKRKAKEASEEVDDE